MKIRTLTIIVSLFFALHLNAQRMPYVGYIFPAGGKQGSSFNAMLSGQYLDGVTNATISGEGVKLEIIEYIKPLNGRQVTLLRDRMRSINQALKSAKKGATQISFYNEYETNKLEVLTIAEAEKQLAEIRKKLSNPKNQRPMNPQMAEDVLVKITIDKGAACGDRELRLKANAGHSNPVKFYVSNLPEYTEEETVPNAPGQTNFVTIPVVVNGRILQGDVDRFHFRAKKGDKLVFIAYARDLMPYIADAVPGWFQATLAIYDSKGKEIEYSDDFKFNPDPVIYFEVPQEGLYSVEIKDAIYRGREDFVYRIAIGEFPFITSIYPLGCSVNETATVALKGWNLPVSELTVNEKKPGVIQLSVTKSNYVSNLVPFCIDTLPEMMEKEPNNSIKTPQPVSLPMIINGKIDKPDDWDVFSFRAEAGTAVVVDVKARRLNSLLDSVIEITDITGKRLAINDDSVDPSAALLPHQADSYIYFNVPTTGRYFIHLTDAQHNGGDDYAYRLRVSQPMPDFELRVVPSSVSMRAGSSTPITIYALRKDGFTNDIKLMVKSPDGFSLPSNARIPATTNQMKFSLTANSKLSQDTFNIVIEGTAKIGDNEVAHIAQSAQDMTQAFYYHHLVPTKGLIADIIGRVPPPQKNPLKKK